MVPANMITVASAPHIPERPERNHQVVATDCSANRIPKPCLLGPKVRSEFSNLGIAIVPLYRWGWNS
jgi:hypothetical protein